MLRDSRAILIRTYVHRAVANRRESPELLCHVIYRFGLVKNNTVYDRYKGIIQYRVPEFLTSRLNWIPQDSSGDETNSLVVTQFR
jgi:hypothetical protein